MTEFKDRGFEASELVEKYSDLTPLARQKALVLEYGVALPLDSRIFNTYPGIEGYKTKFARIKPCVENFRYIDKETDTTIIASELLLGKGETKSLVKVNYRENSPLTLDKSASGFVIREKKNRTMVPIGVELVPKKGYSSKKLPVEFDESKPFLNDFVQIVGQDRIGILAYEGCWHWNTKRACQFCDANPKREDFDTAMPSLNSLSEFGFDEMEWWKKYGEKYMQGIEYAFSYLLKNESIVPHRHLQLMAGNLPKSESLWEICRQISARLNKVQPISTFDSYLNIGAPGVNVDDYLKMAKEEMGFKQIAFNLEVIGEGRFKEVCPGKSNTIGYKNYVKALELAVKYFGFGNVRSNFVLGAQPVEELIGGIRELANKGIVADYSVFVPKRGTPWETKPSPAMEDVVSFTKDLVGIYKEHGFKGIYCCLSSRSNIFNEMLNNL